MSIISELIKEPINIPCGNSNFGETIILDLRNLSVASLEPSLPNQLAVVGEGQELQVTCLIPSGAPLPKIYWKNLEGHIISDSGPIRVEENTLIITKADVNKKSVNYTCTAENLAGTTEITVQVFVSSKFHWFHLIILLHSRINS